MRRHRAGTLVAAAGVVALTLVVPVLGDWPQFRGPRACGIAEGQRTATTWNIESGENVRWKTPIPGLAHSSPVIAGDRIFVTTAVRQDGDAELKVGLYGNVQPLADDSVHEFRVICLERATGDVLWEKTAIETVPEIKRHPKGSHAASSPVTDGRYVVAFFGSEGIYCYDIEGNEQWSRDFGVLDSGWYVMETAQWGFASSPVIHEDMVIVQVDVRENSFVAALDLKTGETVWRTPRSDVPTWSTPAVLVEGDRRQVICNGWKHIGGYDLDTGEELWKLEGGGDIPVPTPIVAHDLIFITNAHGRLSPIIAVSSEAAGALEFSADDEHIAWMYERRGNYMQTPLVYGDLLFLCSDAGIVSCYDAKTGTLHFRQRLGSGGSGFTASPVAADGKMYYTSEYGEVYVIEAAPEFNVLAVNDMGVECMATPAIDEGVIYWRTRNALIAIQPSAPDSEPTSEDDGGLSP